MSSKNPKICEPMTHIIKIKIEAFQNVQINKITAIMMAHTVAPSDNNSLICSFVIYLLIIKQKRVNVIIAPR